jgi:hypothetical protein
MRVLKGLSDQSLTTFLISRDYRGMQLGLACRLTCHFDIDKELSVEHIVFRMQSEGMTKLPCIIPHIRLCMMFQIEHYRGLQT